MIEKTDWQLRYRSPGSPTKGVDDVLIQTNSPDPARAREVADYWLARSMAHPSTTFVYLRRVVVQTEDDMVKEQAAQSGTGNGTLGHVPEGKAKSARVGA